MDVDHRIAAKLKQTAQLLFFRRHYQPGVKEWELKKILGESYDEILQLLNKELDRLGMQVTRIGDKDDAWYIITLKDSVIKKATGWRVDDMAALAATLAFLLAHQGKAPRKDLENLLKEKFPRWKASTNVTRFIKLGYLQDEKDLISIGWRTMAEVDRETLLGMIMTPEKKNSGDSRID